MASPRPGRGYAFLDHPLPLAFAHRGAHEDGDENTGEAFERAVALGYRYIETDVQASRDGVGVLFHDDTLDRVFGRAGRFSDFDWRELSALRTARGERLVRLDEALAAFPQTRFNLDAKTEASVGPTAEAIRRGGATDRVCVAAFDVRRTLQVLRLAGGDICWSPGYRGVALLWLAGWGLPVSPLPFPAVQVPTHFRGIPLVTPRFVRAAHARSIQVHVWTVDEQAEMERLLDIGVDGLMTDWPGLLRRTIEARGLWAAASPGT